MRSARPTSCAAVPSAPRSNAAATASPAGGALGEHDLGDAVATSTANRRRAPSTDGCRVELHRVAWPRRPGDRRVRRTSRSATSASTTNGVATADRDRRRPRLARGEPRRASSAGDASGASRGEQRRRHRRGLDERLGQRGPAGLLEQQHQVELVHAQPAVRLGHSEPDHAHLGQRRPHRRRRTVGAVVGASHAGAHRVGRALLGQQVAHRVAEQQLVVGEGEAHGGYFLGRPSTRSATMLRWISLVPA